MLFFITMLAAVCLRYFLAAAARFIVSRSERLRRSVSGDLHRSGLDSPSYVWGTSLPIYLVSGAATRSLLLLLYPYVSLVFSYIFGYRARRYIRRQMNKGVFLGQAREWKLTPIQQAQRSGFPLLVSVLVVMLYGGWFSSLVNWPSFWKLEVGLLGWVGLGLFARKEESEIVGSRN